MTITAEHERDSALLARLLAANDPLDPDSHFGDTGRHPATPHERAGIPDGPWDSAMYVGLDAADVQKVLSHPSATDPELLADLSELSGFDLAAVARMLNTVDAYLLVDWIPGPPPRRVTYEAVGSILGYRLTTDALGDMTLIVRTAARRPYALIANRANTARTLDLGDGIEAIVTRHAIPPFFPYPVCVAWDGEWLAIGTTAEMVSALLTARAATNLAVSSGSACAWSMEPGKSLSPGSTMIAWRGDLTRWGVPPKPAMYEGTISAGDPAYRDGYVVLPQMANLQLQAGAEARERWAAMSAAATPPTTP